MTLRTLNYGNYGIFLIMGNAGFCPSTVWGLEQVERGFEAFSGIMVLRNPTEQYWHLLRRLKYESYHGSYDEGAAFRDPISASVFVNGFL